jgi:multidrug efflux system outer membrane protein
VKPARRHGRAGARATAAALALGLAACTVGPDYVRPPETAPSQWNTMEGATATDADALWRPARPSHAPLALDWWRAFHEPALNALEEQALAQSQTLAAASARYAQARASLANASAQQIPEVGLAGNVARTRTSANRPVTNYASIRQSTVQNLVQIGPSISYDTDLFGRIRREVESASASAEQSHDDLANARLVLTTDLATDYFSARQLDAEIDVLNQSVALQQKALDYVNAQHELGAVSGLDVLQQQSQLDTTRLQAQLLQNQRARYAHAIAALAGIPAPQFTLAAHSGALAAPEVPPGVPSELLQRRPDIASAERAMAAANARIGVAKAAFFPSLTLTPGIGWESTSFGNLLSAPSLLWTLGAAAGQVIFDGGRRAANVAFANEGYRIAEANYRQTVLDAFQQVQDSVTGLSVLAGAATQSHAAVTDARRLLDLANDRYSGGLVAYLDVITAQQTLLTNQRQDVQIRGQQMTLSVSLIKALGGGWDAGDPGAGNTHTTGQPASAAR